MNEKFIFHSVMTVLMSWSRSSCSIKSLNDLTTLTWKINIYRIYIVRSFDGIDFLRWFLCDCSITLQKLCATVLISEYQKRLISITYLYKKTSSSSDDSLWCSSVEEDYFVDGKISTKSITLSARQNVRSSDILQMTVLLKSSMSRTWQETEIRVPISCSSRTDTTMSKTVNWWSYRQLRVSITSETTRRQRGKIRYRRLYKKRRIYWTSNRIHFDVGA